MRFVSVPHSPVPLPIKPLKVTDATPVGVQLVSQRVVNSNSNPLLFQIDLQKKTVGCEICGHLFKWKCSLERHMQVHSVWLIQLSISRSHSADQMDTLKVSNLMAFLLHSQNKRIKCDICPDKSFKYQRSLIAHLGRAHSGEWNFPLALPKAISIFA